MYILRCIACSNVTASLLSASVKQLRVPDREAHVPHFPSTTYNRETNTCEMIKKGWLSFLQEPSLLDLTEGLLDAIYKFYIFIRYILITKFVFRSYKVFIHLNRCSTIPTEVSIRIVRHLSYRITS